MAKKILSIVFMLGIICLSMSGIRIVTFADEYVELFEEETDKNNSYAYEDSINIDADDMTDSVIFNKAYILLNEGTKNPKENFAFKIEKVSAANSSMSLEEMPSFDDEYVLEFDENEAISTGKEKEFEIPLEAFSKVGQFTYKITEEKGTTAGVTYEERPVLLTILVTNSLETGKLQKNYYFSYENETGQKIDHIENTYSAGSLNVSKKVQGTNEDNEKIFHAVVEFNVKDESTVLSTITYKDDGEEKTIKPEKWKNGSVKVSITLKDNETISFENIPYGVTYSVTEKEANKNGFKTTYSFSDVNKIIDSKKDSVTIDNSKENETSHNNYKNSYNSSSPKTGDEENALLWIVVLASGVLLIGILVKALRKEDRR